MNTLQNESIGNTIVAFHIGRGGHFNNQGHLSYCGENTIGHYTNDLFIGWKNEQDIVQKIGDRENLIKKYENCRDAEDFTFFEKLGFDFGEKIYITASGNHVGLSVEEEEETGIGRINIDNDYDTTYTCLLSECDRGELNAILTAKGYVADYVREYAEENINELF